MEKKKIVELLFALLVGIAFISSYVSLTNNNPTATTTTTVPPTVYAQGFANAIVAGYGSPIYLNITCKNASESSAAVNLLTNGTSGYLTLLENNNSIINFYNPGWNITVAPENMSAYQVYNSSLGKLGAALSSCVTGYGTASVQLPSVVSMTAGTQTIPITFSPNDQNVSVPSQIVWKPGTGIRVKVFAFVTQNGTVYGSPTVLILK